MNTFSANSLKVLDKSLEEFEKKYIAHLDFFDRNNYTKEGEKLHALMFYYLSGFDISKIENSLSEKERKIFESVKNHLVFIKKNNFITTEESFLIKERIDEKYFYLTGRFDAVYKDENEYIIYDWKSKNIPKDPDDDLQSIVYLYSASKIYNTKEISICYFSLETKEARSIQYKDENSYYRIISNIIKKLPEKYLT